MKPIIYLDMDGVLADFEGWSKDVIGHDWQREIDEPEWGRYKEFPDIYQQLPVMNDALELYHGCVELIGNKNQVQILTALPNRARHHFPDAALHKIMWAREHISADIRVHFGPFAQDKQYHKQHPHDVLIDDVERNIQQWNAVGGLGILHTSTYVSLQELSIITYIIGIKNER